MTKSLSGDELDSRIQAALEMAKVGQYDGAHHKMWTIDQIVRILTGDGYDAWVEDFEGPEDSDGDKEYRWDTGIAP